MDRSQARLLQDAHSRFRSIPSTIGTLLGRKLAALAGFEFRDGQLRCHSCFLNLGPETVNVKTQALYENEIFDRHSQERFCCAYVLWPVNGFESVETLNVRTQHPDGLDGLDQGRR